MARSTVGRASTLARLAQRHPEAGAGRADQAKGDGGEDSLQERGGQPGVMFARRPAAGQQAWGRACGGLREEARERRGMMLDGEDLVALWTRASFSITGGGV